MTNRYYSGVGMREPELEAEAVISSFAKQASADGFVLRTAKGKGVDRLFVTHHCGDKELITNKLEIPAEAYEIAARNHGAWELCDDRARRLHAMNVMIYLGPCLRPCHSTSSGRQQTSILQGAVPLACGSAANSVSVRSISGTRKRRSSQPLCSRAICDKISDPKSVS
jgi:hypothetical protein